MCMCKGKNPNNVNTKAANLPLSLLSIWQSGTYQAPKDLLKEHYEEKRPTIREGLKMGKEY